MDAIEMVGIEKRFGPVIANDRIDFNLIEGEIHALLGENGAGKTTLMRILYGLYRADNGTIRVGGEHVHITSPKDAIHLGIGMVTQHFALVSPFSVAENVVLGFEERFQLNKDRIESQVAEAAQKFGIEIDPRALVRHLSVGQKQRVEILKALFREARVLILDEPTAVLVPQEVEALFKILRRLRLQGISIVFISHKLNEVKEISDRVTVLRDGRVISTVETSGTTTSDLARMMVGRETFGVQRQKRSAHLEPVLHVRDLWANDDRGLPALREINLALFGGEILGVAGVGGNGQKELAGVLCGVHPPLRGEVTVCGRNLTGCMPHEFTTAGMGRIPEDRHAGVIGELTVAENLVLEELANFSRNGILDRKQINRQAEVLIDEFQIKARPSDRARTLSGGNLQKVLLARALAQRPKVLVAPQPTRGLDVGATEYVHQQLLAQRTAGAGVLLISEDLDEILALSDRIAVIYEGQIVGILDVEAADEERLGLLMSGAVKENEDGHSEVQA